MDQKIAVIDLGTNTFHLAIAEWMAHHYTLIYQERIAAKIGMGGINAGYITQQGIERALVAMKQFKKIIDQHNISKAYAFGTSAFRNAKNGSDVAKQLQDETGIDVKIISGDEEAFYIYKGVSSAVKMSHTSLVVDIGGGSVEFIIGNSKEIFWKHSFEIGAQRLLEKFQRHDPILAQEVNELNSFLENVLPLLFEQLKEYKPKALVGSSGTFDTLSEIHCLRHKIPYNPDNGETPLTFETFNILFDELIRKNRQERMEMDGMIDLRVDMIVVACCLIKYLSDNYSFESVHVSTYSLKEGVLAFLSEGSNL